MASTPLKYLNQYILTALNVGGGIDNSQTTGIVLQAVTGLDITKAGVALLTYADPINTSTAEWITYTSINGSNELQGVVRGAEGFSAKAHLNQAVVAFPLSESHINDLNAMFDSTGLDAAQIATPASPSSGRNKIYPKSDGKFYVLNSSGTETAVGQSEDGWIASGETWTYASADDPTFTFTIAGVDLTTKYSAGMRIKLTQTTVKYFIITKVAFSTDTTITVYGGTDYDLANAAITSPYYSTQKAPALFPLDPAKWSVLVTDTTDRTAGGTTASVWYNISQGNITLPIGVWNVFRSAFPGVTGTSTSYVLAYVTLSTANNTESDKKYTDILEINAGSSTMRGANVFTKEMLIAVTSKTAYYTNVMGEAATVSAIGMQNSRSTLVLRATCAYL